MLTVLALAACATAPPPVAAGLEVADESTDEILWRGAASYTVRAARAGIAERAVGLPGLGEVHVGVAGDSGSCRFVWSRDGLERLVVYAGPAGACAELSAGRLCFRGARFRRPEGSAAGASASSLPLSLRLVGCADENDLLWGKIDGSAPATVGPRAWRERCVPVPPPRRACALSYLRKDSIIVATHPAPDEGFRFAWDGEGWRACFLEKEAGAYELRVLVEDVCGGSRSLRLAGDSADLDD